MNLNFKDKVKQFMFLEDKNFKTRMQEENFHELRKEEFKAEAYFRA